MKELYVLQKEENGVITYLKKPRGTSSYFIWISDLQDATTYTKKAAEDRKALEDVHVINSGGTIKIIRVELIIK